MSQARRSEPIELRSVVNSHWRLPVVRRKAEEERWLPALEAAQRLAPRFGGLTIAKQAIALGLREAMLRARAEWGARAGKGDEVVEIEATAEQPIEIPPDVWLASENWEADRLGWSWQQGVFEVQGLEVEDDRYYGGVTFRQAEIEAIDPDLPPYCELHRERAAPRLALETVRSRRGSAARKWDWEPAFADLVALADLDGLEEALGTEFKRGFQATLEKWFATWFESKFDESPSEDQRRIHARMIVHAIQQLRTSRRASE